MPLRLNGSAWLYIYPLNTLFLFLLLLSLLLLRVFPPFANNIFNMIFFSVEAERKEKREGNVTNPELLFAPLSIQMLLSEFVLALTQPVHVVLDGVCSSSDRWRWTSRSGSCIVYHFLIAFQFVQQQAFDVIFVVAVILLYKIRRQNKQKSINTVTEIYIHI